MPNEQSDLKGASGGSSYIDLLKYPVLVISVILGIIALDTFDYNIVAFGAGGIELEKKVKNTLEGSAELSMKVDSLEQLILALQEKVDARSTKPAEEPNQEEEIATGTSPTPVVQIAKPKMAQSQLEASDITTKFSKNLAELNHTNVKIGWIWIGDYKDDWSKVAFKSPGETNDYTDPPATLTAGMTIQVTGNMYLREQKPEDDDDYYRSVKSLGIVPKGSLVEVLATPKVVPRDHADQYWMKVKYEN